MTQQPWPGQQPAPQYQQPGYPPAAPPAYQPPVSYPPQAPAYQQPPSPQAPWGTQQPQAPQHAPVAPPVAGDEFDDFFSGGVKGEPGFDWGATHNAGKPMVGAQIIGTIVEMVQGQQTKMGTREPLFFDDGSPRMQVAITLQTDLRNWQGIKPDQIPVDPATSQPKHPSLDTGLRRIFVKSDMKRAVTEACNKVGQKPRKGGKLAVRVKGFEDVGKGNPKTLYDAAYQPAPEDGGTGGFFDAGTAPVMSTATGQPVVHQQQVPPPPQQYQQPGPTAQALQTPAPGYPEGVGAAYPAQQPPPDFAQPGYQGPPATIAPPQTPPAPQYDQPPF